MFFVYHGTCMDAYIGSEAFDLTGDQHTVPRLPDPGSSKGIHQTLFEKLLVFFRSHLIEPQRGRSYLPPLDKRQFDELCVDMYHELVRRGTNHEISGVSQQELFSDESPALRGNHAFQKLGWLPTNLFDGLARDVYFELCDRYPWLSWARQAESYSLRCTLSEYIQSHLPFDEKHSQVVNDTIYTVDDEFSTNEAQHPDDRMKHPPVELNRPLSIDDSLGYLDAMMSNFQTTPELYNTFWRLVGKFKSQSIDMPDLIHGVANLFTNHPTYLERTDTCKTGERNYFGRENICDPPSIIPPRPFSRQSIICLDGKISRQSEYVVASGGSADIWTGSLGSQTVAIKTMRAFSSMGTPIQKAKLLKRIWREYLAWSRLSHPNVIECLGFSYDFAPQAEMPSLISPWMFNGTVLSYIGSHPNSNRLKLIIGIGKGLCYLHTRKPAIVHGDLRAGNILVSDAGDPCLTDFGLSRILDDTGVTTSSSEPGAGSLRWMAPELFNNDSRSENSDVWAYGMTVLEILSEKRPYHEFNLEPAVFHQIIDGRIPSRPFHNVYLTDKLWSLCRKCWRVQPKQRPSMCHVMVELANVLQSYDFDVTSENLGNEQ